MQLKDVTQKSIQLLLAFLVVFQMLSCEQKESKKEASQWTVNSPDDKLKVVVSLNDTNSKRLEYKVLLNKNGQEVVVVEPSPLGIVRADQAFDTAMVFVAAENVKTIDEKYTRATGKQLENRNHANELTLAFKNPNGAQLNLVLRAYNDGAAFRYVFPEKDNKEYTVTKELTGFKLPEGGLAWVQPYDSATMYTPAYERYYINDVKVGQTSPLPTGWCFPGLFQSNENWVLLTEAALQGNFYGSHLQAEAPQGLYTVAQPDAGEGLGTGPTNATSTLPWEMPWRVMIVGDKLGTIVESNLVSHLNPPSKVSDMSWIKPGKSSWSWWSDNASSKDFVKLKAFVDLAAAMGWEYSLVDANWNIMTGGNLEQLAQYAKQKGVKLLVWYNSGGPHNKVTEQPRDVMFHAESRKEEMKKLQQMGVAGIKVDFFQSDKQPVIKLYHDMMQDAADHQLLVNFHGCTIPRGWSRTWPNLISMESVKGAENYIFASDYPESTPVHNLILPFTRNVVGPMDYTPVTFSNQQYPHLTSNGHELALTVAYESGIIHLADRVQAYKAIPAEVKQFLKDVPAAWDETKFVAGFPGDDAVVARRKGDAWFVGGISGETKEKDLAVDFSFLGDGNFEAVIIKDGQDNKSFLTEKKTVTKASKETIHLLPRGGFVMKVSKAGTASAGM